MNQKVFTQKPKSSSTGKIFALVSVLEKLGLNKPNIIKTWKNFLRKEGY